MARTLGVLFLLGAVTAQQVGDLQKEIQPELLWRQCISAGSCETVTGNITVDAEWRWIHAVNDYRSCYQGNEWDDGVCNSVENCTTNCAYEGADYQYTYGIKTSNDSLSLNFKTYNSFAYNVNNRVFLLGPDDKYQTFTLMDNEFAFDVELPSVECGLNSALYFVAMDEDGGLARYPTNKAGAKYGSGYCDASCPRSNKFVGGKANYEGWTPDANNPTGGMGDFGACCPEFDVWNSNAHAFSMSSKPCLQNDYKVCWATHCDPEKAYAPGEYYECDKYGCDYNPYRLGVTDSYGRGKVVDTAKKFTVVTQFRETGITQYFIQDGKKIERPAPAYPDFPDNGDLSPEYCENLFLNFNERDRFAEFDGWTRQNEFLRKPMVLTMSISHDYWAHNLWLDSIFPPYDGDPGLPGKARGDCPVLDHEPWVVENLYPTAKVVWSNIRFGPIGSTAA